VLVLSRVRESFADERSVHATRDPNALASALIKISYGLAKAEEQVARAQSNETADAKKKRLKMGESIGSMVGGTTTAMGISSVKGASSFALATVDANGAFSAAALANAIRWEVLNPWARWFELHSTHPLTGRRVRALGEAARKLGISPLYDSASAAQDHTGTSRQYTGSFLKEFLIYALPLVTAVVGVAAAFAQVKSATDLGLPVFYALIGYGIGKLIKTAFIYPALPSAFLGYILPMVASKARACRTGDQRLTHQPCALYHRRRDHRSRYSGAFLVARSGSEGLNRFHASAISSTSPSVRVFVWVVQGRFRDWPRSASLRLVPSRSIAIR
jgi:hypothetical protein